MAQPIQNFKLTRINHCKQSHKHRDQHQHSTHYPPHPIVTQYHDEMPMEHHQIHSHSDGYTLHSHSNEYTLNKPSNYVQQKINAQKYLMEREDDERIRYRMKVNLKELEYEYKIQHNPSIEHQYPHHNYRHNEDHQHKYNNKQSTNNINEYREPSPPHSFYRYKNGVCPFADAPTEPLDIGTFLSEPEVVKTFEVTPPKRIKKPHQIKIKNTPSKWNTYRCDPPSTPSSNDSDSNDDYDYDEKDDHDISNELWSMDLTQSNELYSTDLSQEQKINNNNGLLLWMNRINGVMTENDGYNIRLSVYNELSGGKCYEMEREAKYNAANDNMIQSKKGLNDKVFNSYLNYLKRKDIFYLNDAVFYENMVMYLDGKSIFNGLMITCKKLYHWKFMDESNIWDNLLHRDFPLLFDDKCVLLVPYVNADDDDDDDSLENHILSRNEEKRLYFTKIKNDKFWKLLYNLAGLNLDKMDNKMIKEKWRDFKWNDLLFGKDNDFGFNAYKELTSLRYSAFVIGFGVQSLPSDSLIDYFCNAMRKVLPSGEAIIYLNPWISSQRVVHWKKTEREIFWLKEYGSCWALSKSDDNYDEMNVIPSLIELIGTIQFQNGKTFKPRSDWIPFLQSYDPNVYSFKDVKDGWFQKQFLLNEMEHRLKNIRTLIEIVRQ